MEKMQEQEEEKTIAIATKERSRKEIKEEQRESEILLEKRGIYIHIPFCKQKCGYCDFHSFAKIEDLKEEYVEALCNEITEFAKYLPKEDKKIDTIFFGGGTPSMLEKEEVEYILKAVFSSFDVEKNVEITLECNPESITEDKMEGYRKSGVNRISIGVQSLDNEILKIIGRIHDKKEVFEKFKIVEKYFDNISVDMMFGLPKQTVEIFKENLKEALDILAKGGKLKHISVYSLILEEGTKFWNNSKIEEMLPNEEEERKMYTAAQEILKKNGYMQYEISNFAKEGYESKHNLNCWKQHEYYGFGIGASSYYNNVRYMNIRVIQRYIGKYLKGEKKRFVIRRKEEKLELQANMKYIYENYNITEVQSFEEKLREKTIIGLRMEKGIVIEKEMIENPRIYNVFAKYLKLKYLKKYIGKDKKEYICLTEKGKNCANIIWQELV